MRSRGSDTMRLLIDRRCLEAVWNLQQKCGFVATICTNIEDQKADEARWFCLTVVNSARNHKVISDVVVECRVVYKVYTLRLKEVSAEAIGTRN